MATNDVTRFLPCYILRDSNIPCAVWCEDAVGYYGVPTVVFNFHILVPDIAKAAEVLIRHGWLLEDDGQTRFGIFLLQSAHRRLTPPINTIEEKPAWLLGQPPPPPSKLPQRPTTTILLPASEWFYTFPSITQSFFPTLPALLDALLDKILDQPPADNNIWDHLAVLIGYLYAYVPDLKEKCFAEHLKYENRQFHYDSLSGMSTGTAPFIQHERKIRDALRAGTFQLCKCSADEEDEDLFNNKVQARIRESNPSSCSPEDYEAEKQRVLENERLEWLEYEANMKMEEK